MAISLIDSYSITNSSGGLTMYSGSYLYRGQTFSVSSTTRLINATFYFTRANSPTGTVRYEIYAHTGTFGSTGKPTGSVLAYSEEFDISVLPTSASPRAITLRFTGNNQITLNSGTNYCLCMKFISTFSDSTNYLGLQVDSSSSSHSGNYFYSINGSTWSASSAYDFAFYINGTDGVTQTIDMDKVAGFSSSATSATRTSIGQTLTGTGAYIDCASFLLFKGGSPTGSIYAKIYAHTGTFGSTGKPTGSALATSDAIDISTLSTDISEVIFTFSGANKIALTNGTYYCICIEYTGGDSTNKISILSTLTSYHSGNGFYYSGSWNAEASTDYNFALFGDYGLVASTGSYTYTGISSLLSYVRYRLALALGSLSLNGLPISMLYGVRYVGGYTTSSAGVASGNLTVSLTSLTGGIASSPSAGDVVIVSVASGSTADNNLGVTTSGYTEVADLYSDDSYDTNLSVNYKVMGASPDTSVDVTHSGNTSDALTVSVRVYRNFDTGSIFDVAAQTATGTNTGRPTPPAITPSTQASKIICIGAGAYSSTADFTFSDLSNTHTQTSSDTNDSVIGAGDYNWVSGTFTPAGWTGNTTSSSASWCAVTLVLKSRRQQLLTMVADYGSYAITMITSSARRNYNLLLSYGSYILTGNNMSFQVIRRMLASAGSYILTGSNIILTSGKTMIMGAGHYAMIGYNIVIKGTGEWLWHKVSKNIDTWTNTNKNDSSWSETNKNSTSYTYTNKNTTNYTETNKNDDSWEFVEKQNG